jgi:hypothetical protein
MVERGTTEDVVVDQHCKAGIAIERAKAAAKKVEQGI